MKLVILCVVGFTHLCSAQLACDGIVSGMVNSDVLCTAECILDGVTVNGNVLCSTGTLLVKRSSSITSNIQADGTVMDVKLDAMTVSGAVCSAVVSERRR